MENLEMADIGKKDKGARCGACVTVVGASPQEMSDLLDFSICKEFARL